MLSFKTWSRKGPLGQGELGTVLCAAQSHRKLNKSRYISTNICTAAERIMDPEVSIAMRMSSDLLLGLVRIYSKKVEYLLRDSNILLMYVQKAFDLTEANLPKTSTDNGTSESVTLLHKFKLDALDMDTVCSESLQDNNRKHPKHITLEDQNPTRHSFNEDLRNSLSSGDNSVPRLGATIGAEHPDPSNHERLELLSDNIGPPNYLGTEVMRDVSLQYFSEDDLFRADQSEDRLEPDWDLLPEITKQTETDTLADELVPAVSPPLPEQDQQPTFAISEQGFQFFNSESGYGHGSPTFEIRSTPPPQQTLPEQRIQSHRYDHVTILSNRIMNKRITDDCSGILRTRTKCRQDAVSTWQFNKRIKKDSIFFEPLLTGLGSDLCEAFGKDYISGKPYLTTHSPNVARSSPSRFVPSPTGGYDSTPAFGSDTSSLSDQVDAICGKISDLEASTATPVIFFRGRPGVEDTSGPAISPDQMWNSDDGDLAFLAEDNTSSSGPQETTPDCFLREKSGKLEVEPLSARTRAVAKFLKNRWSTTPVVESQSANVSLNKILEGKRRKLCARMVFETLVLKNSGLVNVQQEESFGDVTLTVTPKLSEELFST